MTATPENMIPWDLIGSALNGEINPEERIVLQQWIDSNNENRELFDRLKQAWETDFGEYQTYREADEATAWDDLLLKLELQPQGDMKGDVATSEVSGKTFSMMRWASVAAILIITIGGTWFLGRNSSTVYQTGSGEEKTVSLADGSSIKLSANTTLAISKGYNKTHREVELKTGEAFFEVKHEESLAFIVNLGTARVKDLGTSFLIQKLKDSIKLSVTEGKVAFINNSNQAIRELSAGMNLRVQTGTPYFNPVIYMDTPLVSESYLHFNKTELMHVVQNLEKAYNRKIIIVDSALAKRRFTANLDGQSFEGALEILAKSLSIKYFEKDGVFYLKSQ